MGCYKMPKIISKIKSYATRPPIESVFLFATDPHPARSPSTRQAQRQCPALPYNRQLCASVATRRRSDTHSGTCQYPGTRSTQW